MKKVFVEDFGAKAEGSFDNTKAVNAAIDYAISMNEPAEICFKPNSTYFFEGISQNIAQSVFNIHKSKDLSIVGENTTILTDKARPYLYATKNINLKISGLNFDQKTRAHFVGSFLCVDKEELSACFKLDREIEFSDDYVPRDFALHDTGNKLSRIFYFLKKYEWADKENRILKVYFGNDILGTHYNVKNRLIEGVQLIFPTPNIGHYGERSFTFTSNTDTVFENCRVLNAPYFVFGIWQQYGTMLFKNVVVAPPIDETVDFVSWRDCFHCKSNPGKIIWDSCTVRGCNDDIINLSANMMYLDKVYSPTEIECYWPETHGGYYGDVLPGSDIVIWNVETGNLVSRTKIVETIGNGTNHYILKEPLKDLTTGSQVRVCIESDIGNGSMIVNCDFKGTLRIKHNHTVRNSKLYLLKMWIDYEMYLEGPLARNVLFENTKFYTNSPDEDVYYITCHNSVKQMKDENAYCIENIFFKNCEGLHKGNFYYKDNFTAGSVDEITIIND